MNKVTTDILKVLYPPRIHGISYTDEKVRHALAVQEQMVQDGVDFSECTQREFTAAVKEACMNRCRAAGILEKVS